MSLEIVSGGVAIVRLTSDRGAFAKELESAVSSVEQQTSIVGVVLVVRALSELVAGATLAEWLSVKTEKRAHAIASANRSAVERLAGLQKKTVALVDGPVLGTALEVALACDVRVATRTRETRLGFTETQAGLLPVLSGLEALVGHAGLSTAMALVLSGRQVDADEANALGLVDCLVASEEAEREAVSRARGSTSRHRARSQSPSPSRWRSVEKNPLVRAALIGQKRASLFRQTRGHDKANTRALDLIEVFVTRGKAHSRELGLRLFSELCVSAHKSRLIEVLLDEQASEAETATKPFDRALCLERITSSLGREIDLMLSEGIAMSSIDDACLAWGFTKKPSLFCKSSVSGAHVSDGSSGKGQTLVEEIQLRLVVALLFEAIALFTEQIAPSARDIDLLVIHELGFPRFRGGPLRYADVLGLEEVQSRAASLQMRLGERFAAPLGLVERAKQGRKLCSS